MLPKHSFLLGRSDDSPSCLPKFVDEESFHEVMHKHEIHCEGLLPSLNHRLLGQADGRQEYLPLQSCVKVMTWRKWCAETMKKKKNPSNTKIVQNASVYAQRKQTAQLISTQNKPKRLVYLDLSHTHTCRKTEGQQLSNDFIESKRMKGGRLSILGQHGVREDTYPHGFPHRFTYM